MRRLHRGFELDSGRSRPCALARSSSASASSISAASHAAGSCSASGTYLALRVAPRAAARLGVQHQREQAERLGLLRQQLRPRPAEPDALLGEIARAAPRVPAGSAQPSAKTA